MQTNKAKTSLPQQDILGFIWTCPIKTCSALNQNICNSGGKNNLMGKNWNV